MKDRLYPLDLMRGVGIFLIIIYHCYKNIYIFSAQNSEVFRLLFFTTGFFVFISGFTAAVSGRDMLSCCDLGVWKVYIKKKIVRFLKLFVIVLFANIFFVVISMGGVGSVLDRVLSVFCLFYVDRWDVSYQVLASVGVSVLMCALYMYVYSLRSRVDLAFLVFVVLLCIVMDFFYGVVPYLWRFAFQGVLGCCVGVALRWSGVDRLELWIVIVSLFLSFVMLLLGSLFSYNLMFQNSVWFGFVSSVSFFITFYLFSVRFIGYEGVISKYMQHVGRSSLFYYIVQGVVIIIVAKLFRSDSDVVVVVSSVFVLFCCSSMYVLAERLRRVRSIDRMYRFIFC
ncbi:acyltransferase family protein [Desulfovibrio mangrovi]|uniref:acyltransferase family protein n=1 Tax=Desulfovibrio mangrovi TaxID=2976983 RepID=UPI0022485F1B|nr:acyltransferase family protein [Desulfovibrio mangrovi]UZP67566.1 acyltransferase family protein [Desulfovibrio mangrovi]